MYACVQELFYIDKKNSISRIKKGLNKYENLIFDIVHYNFKHLALINSIKQTRSLEFIVDYNER